MSTQREFYRPKLGKNWQFSGRTIIISRPMRLLSDVVCKMTVKIVGGEGHQTAYARLERAITALEAGK